MKITDDQFADPAFTHAFRKFAVAHADDVADVDGVFITRNRDSGWHGLQCFIQRADGVVDVATSVFVRTHEESEFLHAIATAREKVRQGKGIIGFNDD